MKKKFLSLVVAVAMLFSIVTFVVQADTDGEGDYFYFDIEHFAEDGTKEIYMTPIKIYTNGFYDYSGELCMCLIIIWITRSVWVIGVPQIHF